MLMNWYVFCPFNILLLPFIIILQVAESLKLIFWFALYSPCCRFIMYLSYSSSEASFIAFTSSSYLVMFTSFIFLSMNTLSMVFVSVPLSINFTLRLSGEMVKSVKTPISLLYTSFSSTLMVKVPTQI